MSFLLDTDTCSFHLRKREPLYSILGASFDRHHLAGRIVRVAHCAPNSLARFESIRELLQDVSILEFDVNCAAKFGEGKGRLQQRGHTVPAADLMIASVALAHDLTLVTHNTKDFQAIPDLQLDDWITS